MATRQEIIDVIDKFLENKITLEEAVAWAAKEVPETPVCEDPAYALYSFFETDAPEEFRVRPLREQLLIDREILVHGVPCPKKELGKTLDAYFLAFAPWKKIVLCQIRITENGERILEIMEEGWDGKQLFHEEIPLPLKENGPLLTREDIVEKEKQCESGTITEEEYFQWVLDKLGRESAVEVYRDLLSIYWKYRRPDAWFPAEVIDGRSKSEKPNPALVKLIECIEKEEKERKEKEEKELSK